jgi:hypothetical protein
MVLGPEGTDELRAQDPVNLDVQMDVPGGAKEAAPAASEEKEPVAAI